MTRPSDAACCTSALRATGFPFALVAAFFLIAGLSQPAQSQTLSVLHSFTGGSDGGQPAAGPTLDRSGNLYGTTYQGGNLSDCDGGCGVVYKLTLHGSSWTLNPLYSFTDTGDGYFPTSTVTIATDGTLYGTTGEGGTAFNVHPRAAACASIICPWMEATIQQFHSEPSGGLIFDAAGNLYGTTANGGNRNCGGGCGTVFELSPNGSGWTGTLLYSFTGGSDGQNPVGPLAMDSAGNLYGATAIGGTGGGYGTVFKLTNSGSGWTQTVLYSFQNGNDGEYPAGGVVLDQSGNLYGATPYGGENRGGTVYELTPSGGDYTFNVLYGLSGGGGPYSSLTIDNDGNLYGTTFYDGAHGAGSVFKLTQSNGNWTLTDLYDFMDENDGGMPRGSVALDASGNIFGTTSSGGNDQQGVVFEITP